MWSEKISLFKNLKIEGISQVIILREKILSDHRDLGGKKQTLRDRCQFRERYDH